MDNLITGDLQNIAHLFKLENFDFYHHDVSKFVTFRHLDYILHFASPASPVDYLKIPIQTLKVGSLGTHNLLGLARAKQARILVASTSEVYGDPLVSPQSEDYWGNVNPVGPRGVYDEAKRFKRAITMAYHNAHGLETRIVRIFNTFGSRMRLNDGRAIPPLSHKRYVAKTSRFLAMVHKHDHSVILTIKVEGIFRLLHSACATPINIGNPDEISLLNWPMKLSN
jgi:dTDP-glucose 4,6-dehydratase